jgi:NAD-dependent dihydropyrimidine dehydrogenase PreA subunit
MSDDSAAVYFMSGTGNSLRVATWIRDAIAQTGTNARLVPVTEKPSGSDPDRLVALAFPTHGFTAPWPVVRLAGRLPRGKGAQALVVPTRAGTKIGPLFLPGLEGTAGYLVALILALKGYAVRGVMGLDMPSNFMIAHPGFSEPSARAIIARARAKLDGFMAAVLGGRRQLRGALSLLLGLLLLPVSAAYALLGRFYFAKMMFASSACNGCGLCAERCPFGAIRMWGKTERRPYWTFSCENCLRCLAWCPRQAVESGHSLGLVLYLVTTLPAAVVLVNWLGGAGPGHWAALVLVQYAYVLLSLFLVYLLFTLLIRIPAINRLFTVTTLVHFYRRYHEPDTRLDDLDIRS